MTIGQKIKQEIREKYPEAAKYITVKTNGRRVSLYWTNGISQNKIAQIALKYKKNFDDPQFDYFHPASVYVYFDRQISDNIFQKSLKTLPENWQNWEYCPYSVRQAILRRFAQLDLDFIPSNFEDYFYHCWDCLHPNYAKDNDLSSIVYSPKRVGA